MSCFSDLYERFPNEMHQLALREAYLDLRPVYELDEHEIRDARFYCCDFCTAQTQYVFKGYHKQCYQEIALPNSERERTCGDPVCTRLYEWFWPLAQNQLGTRRRRGFTEFFGKRIYDVDIALRKDAALAYVLKCEARGVENARSQNVGMAPKRPLRRNRESAGR